MNYFIYILILWNMITFFMFGIDKWKSKHNKWRISERTLILSAFFMGGIGGLLGMSIFHHKTQHMKFKILIPLAVVFNIGVVIVVLYYTKLKIGLFNVL